MGTSTKLQTSFIMPDYDTTVTSGWATKKIKLVAPSYFPRETSQQIKAMYQDGSGYANITRWETSNSNVVRFIGNGDIGCGWYLGVAFGTAEITAYADNGEVAKCRVEITL